MWNLMNKINRQSRWKQTHRYREQTELSERWEAERLSEKDKGMKRRKNLIDTDNSMVITTGKGGRER